jgi:predicted regulator of Ras-like GTPase activity (Roadblock/LC7/MglB family)
MSEQGAVSAELSREARLAGILRRMNKEGHFKASVLVGADGLPLSSESSPFDVETMAAMMALVRSTIERARESMGLDEVDEVSVVQADKMRLVCRYFLAGGDELVLAVVAPPYQTYRRLTNRALTQIKRVWRGLPAL